MQVSTAHSASLSPHRGLTWCPLTTHITSSPTNPMIKFSTLMLIYKFTKSSYQEKGKSIYINGTSTEASRGKVWNVIHGALHTHPVRVFYTYTSLFGDNLYFVLFSNLRFMPSHSIYGILLLKHQYSFSRCTGVKKLCDNV